MERVIRVFIADGSRECAELLRLALERETDVAVVGVACRGDDALERFPGSGADLLLCDLLLPGLDGLSLLRRLHASGALPHAIVLSGFFSDGVARQLSGLADNFLPKPCDAEELLRHVRDCVLGAGRGFEHPARGEVRDALLRAGVLPHLDGFRYLSSALERIRRNPTLLRGVTKSLYRDVAKEYGTTPACVERSMRAAIDRAWACSDAETRLRLFGRQAAAQEKSPSNVPFLAAMLVLLEGGGMQEGRK